MSTRGWNKCDDCGRFADPTEMEYGEFRSIHWGYLKEDYWQVHKEGFGCKKDRVLVGDREEPHE